MESFDYLIIGGGVVAAAAAPGIREHDKDGTIGILSADVDIPYHRPPLTKNAWTAEDWSDDNLPYDTAEATGADIRLNTLVTGIDRENAQVVTASGDRFGYGTLLLATGGNPNRIELPEDDRVIYFRGAEDYRTLRGLVAPGKHVAVIGGSYIATEIAAALSQQDDVAVTLIFVEQTLHEKVLPEPLAGQLVQRFGDHGVELRPGAKVTGGSADDAGITLELDDGSSVQADAVVLGLGVSPVVDFAEAAGLAVDDGVVVDERLRTADERIYAAGDIANYPDKVLGRTRVEHVDNANVMGKTVGEIMAGADLTYDHTPFFYTDLFDLGYKAVGRADASLETVPDLNDEASEGVVYYLDGETAVGVLLWGGHGSTDEATAVLADPPAREALAGRI